MIFDKVSKKVLILMLSGLVAISVIFVSNILLKRYFVMNKNIFYHLNLLQKEEYKLNYHLLQSSIYMYYNNDKISQDIHTIQKEIKFFKNFPFFKWHFPKAYEDLLRYEELFDKKVQLIFEFQRYNLPLKNSIIFLSNILTRLPNNINNKEYLKNAVSIISSIFLARQAIDLSYLKDITLNKLSNIKLTQKEQEFNRNLLLNLNVFFKYFPKYKKLLDEILNIPTTKALKDAFNNYSYVTGRDIKIFEILSYILGIFILVLIAYLVYSVYVLEIKVRQITFLLYHDTLTKLYNRLKFNEDVKKLQRPALVLFNIDRFKHINDFYGVDVGDEILKFVAHELLDYVKLENPSAKVYRLGADDFGVLCDCHNEKKLREFAEKFINSMEEYSIDVLGNGINYTISLSAGIAKEDPLLEKADMALKNVKKDLKEKVKFFEKELNCQIKENIKKTHELKYALEHNKIIPYFQGIYDKNKNIVKYEVLARIKTPSGEIKSIFPYLQIARENRQYNQITLIILKKVKEIMQRHKDLNLSLNLSIEDISHNETLSYILGGFLDENIAKRVTFEILESEIENYDIMQNFIKMVKPMGVKVAIDDFGSGYSNFARIMSLDVDYLKIDGSLIKNLDEDEKTKMIVETIVEFAKKSQKETVAEFVKNEDIFNECVKLGIDYYQGFYLDIPSAKFN
ncbi:EAL domain-containing protein [Caminibacter pacificus]|uniref:Diguanylate cyclase (GGDEF)-like protein n=1 Tax=Caminibacter pacificus TaxID=1424653 RepID=A0AAJ4RD05_9BACT|nr:EAL domain-containing protein [Caminibacter pacificus]QCI27702.1 EAL domain-containing protein [Caminibacter pacificus]ROR40122.1 diguanylate cyclase (GGDEF)-like protein [Caminibacter pacificus]